MRCHHCFRVGHTKVYCPDLSAADVLAGLLRPREPDDSRLGASPNDRPTSAMDARREALAYGPDGDRALHKGSETRKGCGGIDHDLLDWAARERLRVSTMPQLAPRTERVCRDHFPRCASCPLDAVCRRSAAPGREVAEWVADMDRLAASVEVDA